MDVAWEVGAESLVSLLVHYLYVTRFKHGRGEIRKEVTKEKAWLRVRRKGIPQHVVVLLVARGGLKLKWQHARKV
nr:hypothetical protein CFP56_27260 [Quercus suber]